MNNIEEFPNYITDTGWEAPEDEFLTLLEVTYGDYKDNEEASIPLNLKAVVRGEEELPTWDLTEIEDPPENNKTLKDLVRRRSREDERFVVDMWVGNGTEGMVFKILDKQNKQIIAGKGVANAEVSNRLLKKEADMLEKLPEGTAPKLHTLIQEGGYTWMFMEYLGPPEWENLESILSKDVSYEDSIEIVNSLLLTAKKMEEVGIRHKDLKPANICIKDRKQAKFLDWSNAYEGNSESAGLWGFSRAYASPEKMGSPEMLGLDGEADNRDDLFAINIIAFQLLTGKHPFRHIKRIGEIYDLNTMEYKQFWKIFPEYISNNFEQILKKSIKNNDLKTNLKKYFQKAFNKDIERRFQTADENLDFIDKKLQRS